MSRSLRNFVSLENKKITWAAAANSQSVQFTTTVSTMGGGVALQGTSTYLPSSLAINNNTTVPVFVSVGFGSATAATTDYEIAVGMKEVIDIGQADFVAIIPESTTTGSVYLGRGLGN